jgi:hypothetical protein
VLVVDARGSDLTVVAPALWWIVFAGFVITQAICTWFADEIARRWVRVAYAGQVAAGAALVLGAPRAGWTAILLIYTAALSVYLVRWPVTVAIIAVNTGVAAAGAWLAGNSATSIVITGALYGLLQIASTLGVLGQQRAQESNRRLTAAHTELPAAGVPNREIASALFLAEGTVKNHVSSVLFKLGVKDRTSAVLRALQHGLLG